ncbi:hypothetical protein JHK85_002358 [Glycine max]|nr:hypothetical protein JHK85_002358 [Glycine max]
MVLHIHHRTPLMTTELKRRRKNVTASEEDGNCSQRCNKTTITNSIFCEAWVELEPVEAAFIDDGSGSDIISDNLDDCDNNASTSGNEEHDDSETTEKLTRVQRKKIRKKKLNEEAIHRGKLIGPLLPPPMLQLFDQMLLKKVLFWN